MTFTPLRPDTPYPMISGIVFDLDGTLADSLVDIATSVNLVLSREGLPTHPVEAFRLMVGNGMTTLVRRALGPAASSIAGDAEVARLRAAVEAEYDRRCLDETRPYPGIAELLAALKAGKLRLAVLSNKPEAFTHRVVEALFPGAGFDPVLGQGDRFPQKPDPAACLHIAACWGLAPARLALVGDSEVDMRTGLAAGLRPLGAAWGFRGRRELEEAGAEGILAEPRDLLTWL